jgi:predicted short-subunit dehydrogenase-like oxidoreductase (DUF2520 family)
MRIQAGTVPRTSGRTSSFSIQDQVGEPCVAEGRPGVGTMGPTREGDLDDATGPGHAPHDQDHDHDHDHRDAPDDDAHEAGDQQNDARDHLHPHPPGEGDLSGRPRLGFIGAGRVGTALAVALSRAGWPVVAVASRDPARRERFTRLVPGSRSFSEPPAILDDVHVAFVTVPDDAVVEVAARLRLYGGQSVVHTSGLLTRTALEPALAAGAMAGSFHPLVAFADLDRAVAALPGSTVAIEADEPLLGLLGEMATSIGAQPVRIAADGKAAYHAAAMLAAGGFVGLLHAIAEVARGAGLDEAGALAIYAPLVRQSLENAESLGIDAALTGPVVRGDLGTVRAHLDALGRLAPDALPLYRAVAEREILIAEARGELFAEAAAAVRELLAGASQGG